MTHHEAKKIARIIHLLQQLIRPHHLTTIQQENKQLGAIPIIISVVAQHYGVLPEHVLGKSRKREYCLPRHVAYYMIRRIKPEFTVSYLAKYLGVDPSGIDYGIRQGKKYLEHTNFVADIILKYEYEMLKQTHNETI